jgi:hypothetical protein
MDLPPEEIRYYRKSFYRTCAKAKKDMTNAYIEAATCDKDIFRIVGWYRKRSNL